MVQVLNTVFKSESNSTFTISSNQIFYGGSALSAAPPPEIDWLEEFSISVL
jgi:hypothetical protein